MIGPNMIAYTDTYGSHLVMTKKGQVIKRRVSAWYFFMSCSFNDFRLLNEKKFDDAATGNEGPIDDDVNTDKPNLFPNPKEQDIKKT